MADSNRTWDVIVVGAGSSGSAIAARASENPHLDVLLIEAGPDYALAGDLPFDLVNSHNNSYTDHDWGYVYEPTEGREVAFPRGRVTGGSSAVNTTIALRGMPEDYDEWADTGLPQWSWDNVLPAFCRLERDLDFGSEPWHGDAGPIAIRRYPHDELLTQHQAFLSAADFLGYPSCDDANDPNGWGAGPQPMNKLGRLRVSCAIGYLAPARFRQNLTIEANTLVRRVTTDGRRCTGVEVEAADGSAGTRSARLVVVAGGALESAPILLRSGIGARAEVERLGVDSVCDRPGVGKNLCDHPALSVVCQVKDASLIDFDSPLIQTILRYTAPGSDKRNDLQIEQISFAGRRNGPPLFPIAAVLEYQYGRGELVVDSADPHARPVAHNRFCEDERDARRLADCVRDTLAFVEAGPLADLVESVTFPDPARRLNDDDLLALCRRFAGSGYHPSGTVKMGPREDDGAVVDGWCQVHDMEGLAVADASIMPHVPRANTNLTSIMIGEKVGEWLRTEPTRYGL